MSLGVIKQKVVQINSMPSFYIYAYNMSDVS